MLAPTPTSSAKPVSVAKICSVVLLFMAMLVAASVATPVSWLWLLLPLAFLAYLDAGSSARGFAAGILAPSTWVFYGGLLVVALAFEYGGVGPARSSRPQISPGLASMNTASSAYPRTINPYSRPLNPAATPGKLPPGVVPSRASSPMPRPAPTASSLNQKAVGSPGSARPAIKGSGPAPSGTPVATPAAPKPETAAPRSGN